MPNPRPEDADERRERLAVLGQLEDWLELPVATRSPGTRSPARRRWRVSVARLRRWQPKCERCVRAGVRSTDPPDELTLAGPG
jgi:hypothetical protein